MWGKIKMPEMKKKHGTCKWMAKYGIIHCEVEGAVINITEGLTDMHGRKVTSVQFHPDKYASNIGWKVIPRVHNVRIVKIT